MAANLWEQTQQKFAQQSTPSVSTSAVNTPSSTGANTTNVNTALKGKGIKPERIGYNLSTNDYSIDGKQFLRANKNYGGAGYTSPNSFMQAWKSYNQAQQAQPATQPSNTGNTPYTASSTVNGQYNPYSGATGLNGQNPYTTDYDKNLQWLMNYAQNPTAIDPYSTPEYAAYQAQSDRRAHQGIRAAQESMGTAGFGRSTALGERAQGIQNAEEEYLNTQMVPQIIAAERARQQQVFNNFYQSLGLLGGQQNRADQQVQQDFTNNYNVGQLTGNYMPAGAQQVINELMGLKQQAETKGVTADQRAGLSSQADALRSQLANMGVDSSLFGANVSAATAGQNIGKSGIRTLGGQQQDLANKNANLNAANIYSNLSGQILSAQNDWSGLPRQINSGLDSNGQPLNQSLEGQQVESGLVTDQQQRDISDRTTALNEWSQAGYATPYVAKILGVPPLTPTGSQAYSDAQHNLEVDKFKYDQMYDAAKLQAEAQKQQTQQINTTTAANLLMKQNANGKYVPFTSFDNKNQAFVKLVNDYGLHGNDLIEAMSKAGFTSQDINLLKENYPEAFQ